jgi:hypothetical protein
MMIVNIKGGLDVNHLRKHRIKYKMGANCEALEPSSHSTAFWGLTPSRSTLEGHQTKVFSDAN